MVDFSVDEIASGEVASRQADMSGSAVQQDEKMKLPQSGGGGAPSGGFTPTGTGAGRGPHGATGY